MFKTRYRKYIALCLLVAFTSQVLAAATLACEFKKATLELDANTMVHHEPALEHMHHHMDATPHTNHADQKHLGADCCKTMGHCLAAGCALITTGSSITLAIEKTASGVEDLYSHAAPNPFISSRYRPPIIA